MKMNEYTKDKNTKLSNGAGYTGQYWKDVDTVFYDIIALTIGGSEQGGDIGYF